MLFPFTVFPYIFSLLTYFECSLFQSPSHEQSYPHFKHEKPWWLEKIISSSIMHFQVWWSNVSCLPIREWINKSIKYRNILDSLGSHWCKINGILNGFKEIKCFCFFSMHYYMVTISRNHKTVYLCNLTYLSIHFQSYYMKNLGHEYTLPISYRNCVKHNIQLCGLQCLPAHLQISVLRFTYGWILGKLI